MGPDSDLCATCYDSYRAGRIEHPSREASLSVNPPGEHRFTRHDGVPTTTLSDWTEILGVNSPAPPVPPGFLVRPEFLCGAHCSFAAYGFVARIEGRILMLTALHVLDELAKKLGIDASGLPTRLTGVRLYDPLQHRWMMHELGYAGPMAVLPGARAGDPEPFSARDIAAFAVRVLGRLSAVDLAADSPRPGDPVWLAAVMPDGSLTRRAVCVQNNDAGFVFRYDEKKDSAKYISGAPILDACGNVVGINSGVGRWGHCDLGHANPLASIREHLSAMR